MNHLPKLIRPASLTKLADGSIHFPPILAEVTQLETSEVLSRMKTLPEGLGEDEAARGWAGV